eukprot:10228502-Alexandrium_andersonii.AAC.1
MALPRARQPSKQPSVGGIGHDLAQPGLPSGAQARSLRSEGWATAQLLRPMISGGPNVCPHLRARPCSRGPTGPQA